MKRQEGFSGKIGFILAAAGSAVGLGNIWRFPYLSAQYGGGIFLLTYLILVLTFGYALLISENGIGRMTRKGPIGAFRKLCGGESSFLKSVRFGGWINAVVPMIILPYYCVIGGWVTKYVVAMAVNPIETFARDSTVITADGIQNSSAHYFSSFISSAWEPVIYFAVFMAITAVVISLGVKKGVERFNKILMPALILLIIGICIYCMFLPGSGAGFKYYLMPDFSKFGFMTIVAAMGQLFFSLSIAMGIMITYGAYMKRDEDLVSCVNHVELFDTSVAFLAGLMIIPAVVTFGGEAAAQSSGPGLIFEVMPQVFASFPCGRFVGVAFFLLVLFAAVTSAISMMETNVHTVSQELHVKRSYAVGINMAEIVGIGLITLLGYSVLKDVRPLEFIAQCRDYTILDSLDFISNSVLMPIGAIFTTILVVAVVGLKKFSGEVRRGAHWKREYIYQLCMSVIVIPGLLFILLDALGIFG